MNIMEVTNDYWLTLESCSTIFIQIDWDQGDQAQGHDQDHLHQGGLITKVD